MSMVDVRHKTVNAVYSVEGYATLTPGLGEGTEGRDETDGGDGMEEGEEMEGGGGDG